MSDWALTSGPLPVLVLLAGAVSVLWLVRGQWRRALVLVVVAAVLAWVIAWYVDEVWKPFADPLPSATVRWMAVALFGLGLAAVKLFSVRGWASRVVTIVAGLLVAVTAASEINREFDEYPTFAALLGADTAAFHKDSVQAVELADWKPPAGLPTAGKVVTTPIPGAKSGFDARDAYIYLPPAYQSSPRPKLPVLMLLAGQPGSPDQWVNSGGVNTMMDSFAAEHRGVAPIVVIPDDLGSETGNPLCVDSPLGNVETYLTKDVRDWAAANLAIRDGGWAVAGLSHGGTCSIQLATRAPALFPTFVDIAGQEEPTLGTRAETVAKAFGGNEDAFKKINPMDVMATTKFPGSAGVFVAGADDHEYTDQQRKVYQAAQRAGMTVSWQLLPGGHSWQVWRPGLAQNVDWLAQRMGLS